MDESSFEPLWPHEPKKQAPKTKQVVPEKTRERAMVNEQYELRDSQGNAMGGVEAKFVFVEDEFKENQPTDRKRQLQSVELTYNGQRLDLLALLRIDPTVTRIFVTNEYQAKDGVSANFDFNPTTNEVCIPPLDTAFGLAVALHEFGHVKQFKNPKLRVIGEMAIENETLEWFDDIDDTLQKIERAFPELLVHLPEKTVLETLTETRLQLVLASSQLHKSLEMLAEKTSESEENIKQFALQQKAVTNWSSRLLHDFGSQEQYEQLKNTEAKQMATHKEALQMQLKNLKRDLKEKQQKFKLLKDQYKQLVEPLNELLKTPRRVMERDATRRAFVWMKQIKKAIGLDLTKPAQTSPEITRRLFHTYCEDSMDTMQGEIKNQGDISSRDALILALKSYDALKKIPVPRRERLSAT
ncbi:MAG: hypothetical protein COX81_02185 [Candidatus Magasanikbacteria bacterium CG_4_10_14_0_2_um_filter_37_12]|uniref:Uncharacterized protein n=1 Tax=Candidatus Magasanikbacteria bacterium CG_4_10_14_0_2_um_filter_37_12 TaxID=1974637 RepID=A0A2M7V847_9BACT|nr:MAG: hypothetical protein COX81_02185 [Candidatus Magasanikbacteria bacterium CG_4_10_14_0_2_um_filter_37_12]